MTQSRQTTSFRRRLLGYDRVAVDDALASTRDELRAVCEQRDELVASATNVQRIGDQVAIMLRALADRAAAVEQEAAAAAERVLQEAQVEADRVRADAAAVLITAESRAGEMLREALEDSQRRAAAVEDRRQVAAASLRVAMDQMRWLTESIEQLDIEAPTDDLPVSYGLTLVIDGQRGHDIDAGGEPSDGGTPPDGDGDGTEDQPDPTQEPEDAVASAIAALSHWTP